MKESRAIKSKYAKYSTEQLEVIFTHLADAEEKELVKKELTERYYQHYLHLIDTAPDNSPALDPAARQTAAPASDASEAADLGCVQAQSGAETPGQAEPSLAMATDLAPVVELPPLTAKSADSTETAAHQAKKKFCFIATAAYGSPMAPEVVLLQSFRDTCLRRSFLGKKFIRLYNLLSPSLADCISQREILKFFTRGLLTPIIFLVKQGYQTRQ